MRSVYHSETGTILIILVIMVIILHSPLFLQELVVVVGAGEEGRSDSAIINQTSWPLCHTLSTTLLFDL